MSGKHTPGPWRVIGEHQTEVVALEDTPDAIVVVDTRFFQQQTNPREKEDARLIAAAPDLLAALKDAVEALSKPGGVWYYPDAVRAIAKAEGGAQ